MKIVDIPIGQIDAAPWNSNEMNASELRNLRASIRRFGLEQPLLVREIGACRYETIDGAQRLAVMRECGFSSVPCVLLTVDDVDARFISQALNHISGHENDGLRSVLLQEILESFTEGEIIEILPESIESLQKVVSLGAEQLGAHLEDFERRQAARLIHRTFQFVSDQVSTVDRAVASAAASLADGDGTGPVNPNDSGNALHFICEFYLEHTARL